MSETFAEKHYTRGDVLERIEAGIPDQLGVSCDEVTVEALGGTNVDEFHVGGDAATLHALDKLQIKRNDQVLDVGCGLGGPARRCAVKYGCSVMGVDITKEYIDTGTAINSFANISTELKDRVKLMHGDVTDMAKLVSSGSIDKAYSIHVAMNIEDKVKLASEMSRILKPGGRCIFFDQMAAPGPYQAPSAGWGFCCGERKQVQDVNEALTYPLPWATEVSQSYCASVEEYKSAFKSAGMKLVEELEEDRSEEMLEFMGSMQKKMMYHFVSNLSMTPPSLGIHVVVGEDFKTKLGNYKSAISTGKLVLVELVFEKAK